MLGVLTLRFRRHIACLFYILFYAQWAVGAAKDRYDPLGSRVSPTVKKAEVRLPVITAPGDDRHWAAGSDVPDNFPDSGVIPGHSNVPMSNLAAASPAFALPKAPLGSAMRPSNVIQPAVAAGGPNQPEMQSFTPVGANNMVDLFSGDFSYNIPLLDVGGYPVNIAYHSGRSMDEDASWVGLGWNINPGSITRDMRGVPDDFNGGSDTVTKTQSMKPNINWGLSAGAGVELMGLPLNVSADMGIFHTTYNGWGIEKSLDASLSIGDKAQGVFTGKLGIEDNSQSGITLTPGLSFQSAYAKVNENAGAGVGLSVAAPYNSRT